MHGRWVLAIQDLLSVFQATITRIMGGRCEQVEILRSQWVRDYLSSDCFFDPQWSLPHPTGIGRAYEGHSRFFFGAETTFLSVHSQPRCCYETTCTSTLRLALINEWSTPWILLGKT